MLAAATAIAALVNAYTSGDALPPTATYQGLQMVLLAPVVVPLLALMLGTGALATERENGTLPYLFTRPIHRAAVVLGKGLAAILVVAAATLVAAVLVFAATGAPTGAQLAGGLLALILESVALTALFVLFGTVVPRAAFAGIAYIALYEGFVGSLVLVQNPYTVGYHARGLLAHWSASALPSDAFPAAGTTSAESVLALLAVAALALGLAAAWVQTREYGLTDRPKED